MLRSLLAGEEKSLFKIGACDWSIGRRQQISAFELAAEIGLNGLEVSFDGGPKLVPFYERLGYRQCSKCMDLIKVDKRDELTTSTLFRQCTLVQ